MWRALVVGAVGCVTLVVGGGVAAAQEPTGEQVAAAIAADGWYADPNAVGDREQLAMVAERLAGDGEAMGFALLAAEPPGSSTVFAEDVLDRLGGMAGVDVTTVVVLSDADVGVVSDVWSDRTIDEALDETIDDLRANPTDGLEALAGALASQSADFGDSDDDFGSAEEENSDEGGSDGPSLVLPVLLIGGLIVASYVWRYIASEGYEPTDDSYSSSWSRRRSFSSRSSWRSSSRRSSSSSSSSRRSSRSSSGRGRGGRRL